MKPPKACMKPRVAKRLLVLEAIKNAPREKSIRAIGRDCGVSDKLVRNMKEKIRSSTQKGKLIIPEDLPRSGRPKKFSDRLCDLSYGICLVFL